jgi:predicted ester cyclase
MKRVSTEESRAVVRRYIEDALNGHSRARMDELIVEDYVRHVPGGQRTTGRDPVGQSTAEQGWAACPDWSYEIEVLLAEDDLVAVRVFAGGTHTQQAELGPWRGIAPSGKRYTTTWTAIYRVRDDKIVEQWLDGAGLPTTSEA